ncbi:MAG: polyhydroxyalkanoic acid system family protein [Rhodoferax sp.]|nr:polyhydroxyalkanoic acid system family protein [Rhodoferax sp.]
MADIHIVRKHGLGLAHARQRVTVWAGQVKSQYGMECSLEEGTEQNVLHFTRSVVSGCLLVRMDGFEREVKLGFLLGASKGLMGSRL